MAELLYIQASPRTERSHSIAVADAFVDAYRESHPGDTVARVNLFERPLIDFDGFALQAKYRILHGEELSEEERSAWGAVEELIGEFKSADKYIFAVPMWNFAIPYRLKQYVDVLVQPTYTFAVTAEGGYEGLVVGRPAFLAYARGGEYPPGSEYEAFDMQTRYMETILGFIGFSDIRSVVVEPTLQGGPEVARARRAAAIEKAREMAPRF
ncbi:MAG: FMN-dependent NADH-azoreductase [Planctomycetota bacterium]